MKKINKKGFTLVELLAVVVILILVLTLAVLSTHGLLLKGESTGFDVIVNSLQDSAREAYSNCVVNPNSDFCRIHPIPSYDESDTVTLGELIDYGYSDKLKNPWNKSEKCDRNSTVKVTRTRKSQVSFEYETCLICGKHNSCEEDN